MENRIPKIKNIELKIVASAGAVYYGNGYFFKPVRLSEFSAAATKTLTKDPRPGNFRWHKPWETIKPIDDFGKVNYFRYSGFVNAVGFSNVGISKWVEKYYARIRTPEKIIVSIAGKDTAELLSMVSMLNSLDVLAIEPNLTCTNDEFCHDIWMVDDLSFIETMKEVCRISLHPVVLKLSAQNDYIEIAKILKDEISAVSINSIPWKMIFPGRKSPLEKFGGGGVSGKVAQKFTWKMAFSIADIVGAPVFVPGIWDLHDLEYIKKRGKRNLVPTIGSSSIPPPFLKPLGIIKEAKKLRKI